MTISRHLSVRDLRSYLTMNALADDRDPRTPPPAPADEFGRSSQEFTVDVQVRQNGRLNHIGASGRDIYATSAPLIAEAAQRLLNGQTQRVGASAPGQALDAPSILRALDGDVLTISRPT